VAGVRVAVSTSTDQDHDRPGPYGVGGRLSPTSHKVYGAAGSASNWSGETATLS
jgi:hypothetical protein